MSAAAPAEPIWSPKRWTITIAIIFCLQGGLTWWLSDHRPLNILKETRLLRIRLADDANHPGLVALLELNDPTRFVLPNRASYSGRAWLDMKPLQHRSPGWSNPPQWLQLKPADLLADFSRFAATNNPDRSSLTERSSQPAVVQVPLTAREMPQPVSRMQVVGQLSLSDLTDVPQIPAIDYAGLLAPTVIRIIVDQQGRVFDASLAAGSESADADQAGLKLVRSLQFVPDPRISVYQNARDFDRLREGRVIIHWWTKAPPASTNAPAVKPAVL